MGPLRSPAFFFSRVVCGDDGQQLTHDTHCWNRLIHDCTIDSLIRSAWNKWRNESEKYTRWNVFIRSPAAVPIWQTIKCYQIFECVIRFTKSRKNPNDSKLCWIHPQMDYSAHCWFILIAHHSRHSYYEKKNHVDYLFVRWAFIHRTINRIVRSGHAYRNLKRDSVRRVASTWSERDDFSVATDESSLNKLINLLMICSGRRNNTLLTFI